MAEQGSAEWKQMRLGKVTASKVADVVARTRSGWGASRGNYMADLITERLTGAPVEIFQTHAMAHGIATEPEACNAYAFHFDAELSQIDFVDHPTISMSGCSPDRLVGSDGLLECKCPQPKAHIDILVSETVPDRYVKQIQWQLACLPERTWADFISYCPSMPENMRLFRQHIPRDDEAIAELEKEVTAFLAEVDETVGKLLAKYEPELEDAA